MRADRSPRRSNARDKETLFPSDEELHHGIRVFFEKQNDAGTWEKYFPLFHFPKGGGADHCWHYEVLEAVLREFPELAQESAILEKLGLSLDWLERRIGSPGGRISPVAGTRGASILRLRRASRNRGQPALSICFSAA